MRPSMELTARTGWCSRVLREAAPGRSHLGRALTTAPGAVHRHWSGLSSAAAPASATARSTSSR